MSADEKDFEALLASVSEGETVDWATASSEAAGHADRARIDALREVARIAEFSRTLQRTPERSAGARGALPERWGDLVVLEEVGAGANGQVLRAWDPRLQREVALKLLRADVVGAVDGSPLLEEARALARIRHHHVVHVHGIDQHDGRVGVWMEFVRGASLQQQIERSGALALDDVARIGVDLCHALAAVHAAGLVHRDVKPANVVRDDSGRIVLTDFGLGQHQSVADTDVLRMSGTPMFMAPERLAGQPATTRSDVYAAGATLWCALTGRLPFEARTVGELRAAAAAGPPRALRTERPGVPPALENAILKAMAPDPAKRWATAAEFGAALGAAVPAKPGNAVHGSADRRRSPWLLVAAMLPLVALAGWLLPRLTDRAKPVTGPEVAAPTLAANAPYSVDATLLRRDDHGTAALGNGDRVEPGDQLSLRFHASRSTHVYVLNEDERGEAYLLFPQPLFDRANPLPADSTFVLPGTVGGRENAWTVTSRGGREHFLVVASPEPLAELEAELGRLSAPRPGRPIEYARVGAQTFERLRGVGGVSVAPGAPEPRRAGTFAAFQALSGRESNVQGVWVRQVTLENPMR